VPDFRLRPLALCLVVAACCIAGGPTRLLWGQGDKAGAAVKDAADSGVVAQQPARRPPQGFFEILFSGGPIGVVIMLVLIGLSLTAAYLVFEQILSLRKKELIPPDLSDQVRKLVAAGQIDQAVAECREQPGFLSFVITHGLSEAEGGWSEVEKAMEDALAEQAARLFRRIEYLAVLGNIAPMVGLLGTVTGMLMSFKEVADTEGHAGASQLAEGIYQALVTTVVGLIIAIPALGAFAIFRNRVDQFVAEAAYAALHALSPLKKGAAPAAGASPTQPRRAPAAAPQPPPPPAPPRKTPS
jgi:biopolymer transport protein ExbB